MKQTIIGKIVNYKGRKRWKPNSLRFLHQTFDRFSFGTVTATFSDKKPTRSLAQNNLLWLYYTAIEEETGQPAEDVHKWAKQEFLTSRKFRVFGDEVTDTPSTTTLNKSEFSEFIRKIEARTGIPAPNTKKFYEELEGDKEVEYPEGEYNPKF